MPTTWLRGLLPLWYNSAALKLINGALLKHQQCATTGQGMMLKPIQNKPLKALRKNKTLQTFCCYAGLSASVLLLSACGGGSSSSENEPERTVTPIPVAPAGPVVSVGNAQVIEGEAGTTAEMTFTITLAEASDSVTSVNYSTQDGSASSLGENADFVEARGIVNFAPGETSVNVSVQVLGDDVFEVNETFTLVLSQAQGLELDESSTATGTIELDEDADSKGYFFGSATTKNADGEDVVIDDLIGLAYEERLMLFSKTGTGNVLYDIKNIEVTGAEYSGIAQVYVDGINLISVAVTGATTEASITGTMAGADFANASFEVNFMDESNKEAGTWERINTVDGNKTWKGDIYGAAPDSGSFFLGASRIYQGLSQRCVNFERLW
ncbi:MAG: hypothetical protein JKY01_12420 [Pseudomonadales bacterium]|nr:hypothetical protein [Pseudomonadales bacterium]